MARKHFVMTRPPGLHVVDAVGQTKARDVRIRQGLTLLAGAVALELLVGQGSLRFYWTPLIVGLSYLAAAAAGGRSGGYWATACVLTGWGLAVVTIGTAQPQDVDVAGAYLLGAGAGATLGSLLPRARFDVSQPGLAATIAAAGLILALSPKVGALDEARTYALAIGLVGLLNVGMGVVGATTGRAEPPGAEPGP